MRIAALVRYGVFGIGLLALVGCAKQQQTEHHHHSILDALYESDGALTQALARLAVG
jgi:hypothetical protein